MFARIFRAALRTGQSEGYTRAIEQKVVPILQSFKGFRDEIAMVSDDGTQAVAISLWEGKEDAEAYERASYADVRKVLEPYLAGAPEIHKYIVTVSAAHATAKH